MIADDAVGQHGKGVRAGVVELTFRFDSDAAATVGVINEDQFSPVGMSLFKGREFSWFRPERFFLGACIGD